MGPVRGFLRGLSQVEVADRYSLGCMLADCHSVVGVGHFH